MKKRRVMVDKWITESDKEISMSALFKYGKVDRKYVVTLKCSVYIEFNEKL